MTAINCRIYPLYFEKFQSLFKKTVVIKICCYLLNRESINAKCITAALIK